MKKILILIFFLSIYHISIGQQNILPGNSALNTSLIKPGKYSMSYNFKKSGQFTEIGTYDVVVKLDNSKLDVNTSLSFTNSDMIWKESFVANINPKALRPNNKEK